MNGYALPILLHIVFLFGLSSPSSFALMCDYGNRLCKAFYLRVHCKFVGFDFFSFAQRSGANLLHQWFSAHFHVHGHCVFVRFAFDPFPRRRGCFRRIRCFVMCIYFCKVHCLSGFSLLLARADVCVFVVGAVLVK